MRKPKQPLQESLRNPKSKIKANRIVQEIETRKNLPHLKQPKKKQHKDKKDK